MTAGNKTTTSEYIGSQLTEGYWIRTVWFWKLFPITDSFTRVLKELIVVAARPSR